MWSTRFSERARAYWTAERTQALTGGKRLAILPAEAPGLLRALGLLDGDAAMAPDRARKFFQINHLVRLLEPQLAAMHAAHTVVRIVDAGCGRSYLTLLLAHCARMRGAGIEILGVDRDPDLIAECRRRTEIAELSDLVHFEVDNVGELEPAKLGEIHAVVALHACDTATCDAIALGVALGAELIAVAPCCQAELARAWSSLEGTGGGFAPVWNAPHLRREIAAHLTDAMRMTLLRGAGYEVTAAEFAGSEHTPKNTLLRAIRGTADADAARAYAALVAATGGCGLRLAERLPR
ncbi:MAG: SAM-dependent methyltransferase [Deltaproteobacteria bacterium]|nr:SAM-dependent methyltransferase [Deltaproteobacteria bacterium]